MDNKTLITVCGEDKPGVIAALTGTLFDLGSNLADTSFQSVAGQFDFRAEAGFPDGTPPEDIEAALVAIPLIAGAGLSVVRFEAPETDAVDQQSTHLIRVIGEDRPGLVARLSEVLTSYHANILRMHSSQHEDQATTQYATEFHVSVPKETETALDNALSNLAGSMRLTLSFNVQ